jgi:hypothetical protein
LSDRTIEDNTKQVGSYGNDFDLYSGSIGFEHKIIRGFSQSRPEISGILPRNRTKPLPSTSFSLNIYRGLFYDVLGIKTNISQKFRQVWTSTWAVGACADLSAIITFHLAVNSMQLRFHMRVGGKLQSNLPLNNLKYYSKTTVHYIF